MAAAIWLVSGIQPVSAQPVVTSAAPSSVAVTIYRDPDRPARQAMDRDWLNGFALVSETRTIAVPPGGGEIRFEGVAGGIVPQSAIVTGLPDGVVEKNQDAMLLSPGNLVARALGQRVHLRRTSRATGDVTEQEAVARSGPDGAVVLQTAAGFEALRCTGLAETIVYDELPAGLSARPTLSVRTAGGAGGAATVTLSYLATGFDWQGNYVAELAPSGDRVDLFAWVTLASADETSFPNAETQTVAGRLNREQMANVIRPQAPPLNLQCWPQGTTSDGLGVDVIVVTGSRVGGAPPPAPPPPPAAPMMMRMAEAVMVAQQEELGDLKLYRIPERVTVAAKSQKQVAMLVKPGVRVRQLQRSRFAASGEGDVAVTRVLATRNRSAEGLGVPLPAGGVALFGTSEGRRILLGEGFVEDRAVGEDVEIAIGAATQMIARIAAPAKDRRVLTVTNATAAPVRYEAEIDGEISGARLARRNGRGLWSVTIPANGSASLSYRVPGTS